MKHNWSIRRQPQPLPNATRRWDQDYQFLLAWNQLLPSVMEAPLNAEEEANEKVATGITCWIWPPSLEL